jgi:hypothetical protein
MTGLTIMERSDHRCSCVAAMTFAVAVTVVPTLAVAGTQVSGNPAAVRVEAQDASVEEILTALTRKFDVQFRSSADLDKRLTGTYEGTLLGVVTRVLSGYNSVVKSGEKGLEVVLLGSAKTFAVIGPPPTSKPVENSAPGGASTSAGPFGPSPVPGVKLAQETPRASTNAPSRSGGPTLGPATASPPASTSPPPGATLVPGPATATLPPPAPRDSAPPAPTAAPTVREP